MRGGCRGIPHTVVMDSDAVTNPLCLQFSPLSHKMKQDRVFSINSFGFDKQNKNITIDGFYIEWSRFFCKVKQDMIELT